MEERLSRTSKEISKIFGELKEIIISLDSNIIEEAKAQYIAYKHTTNFVDIVIYRNYLKLFLNIPKW